MGTIVKLLGVLARACLDFVNVTKNDTAFQKAGTVATMIAAFCVMIGAVWTAVNTQMPPQPTPEVLTPVEVVEPAPATEDAAEPLPVEVVP